MCHECATNVPRMNSYGLNAELKWDVHDQLSNTKQVMGNEECWVDGFNYDVCCDPKFGPNGNSQCWDGMFNYNRCCFPRDEL